jgi:hypothetical protein
MAPWLLRYAFLLAFAQAHFIWMALSALAIVVVAGMLYGLAIGAGFFLMARRSTQSAVAARSMPWRAPARTA